NDKEKKLGIEIKRQKKKQKNKRRNKGRKQRRKDTRNRENRSQELPLVSIGHVWTKLQHGPNVTLIGSKGSSTSSLSHVGVTFWPSQNVTQT
ncbi:hypothetical protein PIB30_097710, partial [Stylosanthes scabra]|nr:hypothetical protein [Stylosanthes scabra]